MPSALPKDHIIPYHRLLMEARAACGLPRRASSPRTNRRLRDKRGEPLASAADNASASSPEGHSAAKSHVKRFALLCL